MATNFIPYVWDVNNTNTAPLSPSLLNDGYAPGAYPASAEFNELWRNISGLVNLINSYFLPGFIMASFIDVAPAGWIELQDGSIGNTGSGATLLADPSAQNLYNALWNSITDTYAPVSSGRGLTADLDFAAGKTLTLPSTNGRIFANFRGAPPIGYQPGETFGENSHTLIPSELPPHFHEAQQLSTTPPPLTPIVQIVPPPGDGFPLLATGDGSTLGLNGEAHENRQRSVAVYYYIKL
ncbi:hypothetical protein EBU24_01070 [bacterium]|nr:hypothetical protein [bacterium]